MNERKKGTLFSPFNSHIALSSSVAVCLCHRVCRFLSLSGVRERERESEKERERVDEKGGRERVVVLRSQLIKDHFSRHRLRGVVCVCVCVCL